MRGSAAAADEYHSKDFEWETFLQEIEDSPSLQFHLLPLHASQEEVERPEKDSDAWKGFHSRHSSGSSSSGNEYIVVYAWDCSSEILERADEFVDAADISLVKNRFHPFYCDFCTGFPEWLTCNYCRENFPQKQHDCFSGS